ncbi:outer membrane protein assembly factor BamB family protein [Streptomyces xanthii]|uniref:PQQ-binding-like beta-propeller repeat protein n=1 Tax=Streptomyces xanthii TaxID=2768069 RepID=A0A7H1B7L9_9ACTN|nr:PQQ-binding-like beta-propeller repeat protein [Streptomyces xanthii]QNS04724.1 PQQ-binding-like beta-propeller repeat protein [Streptomyces xanthii]
MVTLAVVLGGIGSLVAWYLSNEGYLPGDAMVRSWSAQKDRAGEAGTADDNWVVGDVAVRSKDDAVTGYGIAAGQDGKKLWEYVPPGRGEICGTAEHAGTGAVLVARGAAGGDVAGLPGAGCTTILALDAKDGRELWKEEAKPAKDAFGDAVPGSAPTLDARGDLAVVAQDRRRPEPDAQGNPVRQNGKSDDVTLRGLDLRTGKLRWTAELPDRCGPQSVSMGEKRVFAVLSCDAGGRDEREVSELTVAAFDRATGALAWNAPIDDRRPLDPKTAVGIESVDPLVLSVGAAPDNPATSNPSASEAGVFVPFDANGRPGPVIDASRDKGVINAGDRMQTAVAGDRLYALSGYWQKGNHDIVVAFDLKTGEQVWSEEMDNPAPALAVLDGRVTVLNEWSTQAEAITTVVELDPDDGEELDERHFRDEVPGPVGGMYAHDGRLITASQGGGAPFTAYERW